MNYIVMIILSVLTIGSFYLLWSCKKEEDKKWNQEELEKKHAIKLFQAMMDKK